MNTENSKINKSHKCFYKFTDKLNLKNPNKSITFKKFITHGKTLNLHIKFKISASTWNNEFDLSDGSYSVSDIQDCFGYTLTKDCSR